jgi:hypothetical protein
VIFWPSRFRENLTAEKPKIGPEPRSRHAQVAFPARGAYVMILGHLQPRAARVTEHNIQRARANGETTRLEKLEGFYPGALAPSVAPNRRPAAPSRVATRRRANPPFPNFDSRGSGRHDRPGLPPAHDSRPSASRTVARIGKSGKHGLKRQIRTLFGLPRDGREPRASFNVLAHLNMAARPEPMNST